MTPEDAHEVWRKAEDAYRHEYDRYFVIQDASEPQRLPELTFNEQAADELTALREAAQAAQDAFVAAIAEGR